MSKPLPMVIGLPAVTRDSFQSLAVNIQSGHWSDCLGTLEAILLLSNDEQLHQLAMRIKRGETINHPAN